jgi:hypothetical protein
MKERPPKHQRATNSFEIVSREFGVLKLSKPLTAAMFMNLVLFGELVLWQKWFSFTEIQHAVWHKHLLSPKQDQEEPKQNYFHR